MAHRQSASYLRKSYLRHWATWLLLSIALCFAPLALAQPVGEMRSSNFIIQMGNFNMTGGTKSGGGYTLTDTVGETAPGFYSSSGYHIYAGFQYIYTIPNFEFQILDFDIPLGDQIFNTFSTASQDLIVSTRYSGFKILARAQSPLTRAPIAAATIPFTNCDSGCTISTAGEWTDPTNNGFGFTVNSPYAAPDFISTSYFRPFADASSNESEQVIAEDDVVVKDRVITVEYQLSVNAQQAAGNYTTAIEYTAIPGY